MAMKKATPAMLSVEGYLNYRNEPRLQIRYMDRTIILTENEAEQLALAILTETSKFKDSY